MIINSLKVQRFKKFIDYKINLGPGINLIKGPNEAGKSTLLEALVSCLFHNPGTCRQEYKAWNTQQGYILEMVFSENDQNFILRKDFDEHSVLLGYADGSNKVTTQKRVNKAIAGFLGFNSEDSYLSTACVRQHELDSIKKAVGNLENILLAGSELIDVSGIIKRLEKRIEDLKRKKAKRGVLFDLITQIQEKEQELKRISEEVKRIEELNTQLKDVLKDLFEKQAEYDSKNTLMGLVKKYKRKKEIEDELNRITKELEEVEKRKSGVWIVILLVILFLSVIRNIIGFIIGALVIIGVIIFIKRNKGAIERYREDLEEKKKVLVPELSVLMEELGQYSDRINLESIDPIKLESELRRLDLDIQHLKNKKIENEALIKNAQVNSEELVAIEERLDNLRREYNRQKMYYDMFSLIRDKLEIANRDVFNSRKGNFKELLTGYFSVFTQNKYKMIDVQRSGDGLGFKIFSPEKNEWISPDELSTGTQDELYLAARLSLLKLIAGDKRPPLILDDPFTSFDKDRMNSAMEVCKEIAKEYQIIIFTCTDLYDIYADNIVELSYESNKVYGL